ncbi:HDIG domain-containing protein [Lujinxingia vulgaris]|uniref:HDIG domain-containing protein n=2 Tax=Lujinxingia vulgaris TaxID=2600176 RepID=A0A5C6XDB5_9DELT|nr:HDIG domain-containing protein [Lujinxingia vulgaris]
MALESRRQTRSFMTPASRALREKRLRKLFDNALFQYGAFAIFVAAVVAIMSGGMESRDRSVTEDMIGQVAPVTVQATRDFPFVERDVAASERLREEVALAVPSVFDWQEGLGDELRAQVSAAFGAMRAHLAAVARERLQRDDPERLEQLESGATTPALLERRLIGTLSASERVRAAFEARNEHFEKHINTRIPEQDFEVLARQGFPLDAENAIGTIVAEVMSRWIVNNPLRIERERDNGVYLRRLRGEQFILEYHVTDLDGRFIGLEAIPRQVEEAARRDLIGISDQELRQAILTTASALVRPNTTYNEAKTLEKRRAARDSVADQVISEEFRRGQILIDRGHIITERHYRIVQEMLEGDDSFQTTQVLTGVAIFSLLLLLVFYGFGRRNIRKFRPQPRDIVFMGTTLLVMLLITRVGVALSAALAEQIAVIPAQAWYFALPVAAGGMLIRLVLDSEHAVIFTLLFSVLVGVIADNSLFFSAFTAMGTLVGVTTVQQVKHRMALMWSGLAVGVVNASAIIAFLLLQGELLQVSAISHVVLGFAGGVASGFFISAVLPLFEAVFGYTTDIKLLELANLNHPLLRELVLRAPGSYHHSMMVGSLCEAAAEEIGANSLLCRVGASYHDIGKAKNPQYFAENQKLGENPHDKLKPNMSALIIKAHVKDGLDMARQHRLPVEIQDFIVQHHGTSLIAYFYHKAKQAEDPDIPEVDEKDFRYPGPRPQSRETAICLLADGIEAASRAMPNPSPARLKGLVQTMINKAFTDGQLDECDLTLQDLNKIARAFTRILNGIYHHRPEYPGGSKRESEKSTDAGDRGRKTRPTRPNEAKPAAERTKTPTPAADASSEVWEIDDDAQPQDGKDDDARRDHENGKRTGSSPGRGDRKDDNSRPRDDLPRLGTS